MDLGTIANVATALTVLTGVVFGLMAKSKYDELNTQCAPTCTPEQTKSGHTDAVIADVAFGVGSVGIVGGILWAILGRERGPSQASLPEVGVHRAAGAWVGATGAGASFLGSGTWINSPRSQRSRSSASAPALA